MSVNIPAMSTREVALNGLEGDPELRNSFLVSSNAAPGDLVAKLVAKGNGQPREIELLARDSMGPENGGNHPWSLEGGNQSLLLLFNNDQRVQTISVAIAGTQVLWRKSYKLQPMETKLLDLRSIVRNKARDDHGIVLSPDILRGEVSWFNGAGTVRGRILLANSATGLARNFSCFIFAAPCSPATLDLIPSSILVGAQSSAEFNYGICAAPDQFSCSGPPSTGSEDFPTSWSSQNTSVASASGGAGNIGTVSGVGAGTSEIIATAENEFGTCSVGAQADVTVQRPSYFFSPSAVHISQPAVCTQEGATGYFLDVSYYVADSSSNRVSKSGMAPGENLNDGNGWHDSFATPTTTRSDGSFDDTPRGACYVTSGHFCAAGHPQSFRLTNSGTVFSIATNTTSRECTDGIKLVIQGNPTTQNKTYTFGNTQ